MGISIHKTRGSIVGAVIEVFMDTSGILTLNKAWIAIDCGKVINPDTVRAQMEGGFTFGLSAALGEEITLKDGRVEQSNFHDYPVARLNQMPELFVHIVDSNAPPGGIGEPGVPPVVPSITNAIYHASKTRIRDLPVNKVFSI